MSAAGSSSGSWVGACSCSSSFERHYKKDAPPPQADKYNHLLRRVNVTSGVVTTLAGGLGGNNYGHADGAGPAASFFYPEGVAMDSAGSFAVVVRLTIGWEEEESAAKDSAF